MKKISNNKNNVDTGLTSKYSLFILFFFKIHVFQQKGGLSVYFYLENIDHMFAEVPILLWCVKLRWFLANMRPIPLKAKYKEKSISLFVSKLHVFVNSVASKINDYATMVTTFW